MPPPRPRHPDHHHHQPWFDSDCKAARRRLRAAAADPSSHLAHHLLSHYKNLCRSKKITFQRNRQARLLHQARHHPAAFWRSLRPHKSPSSLIDRAVLHQYCSALFAAPPPSDAPPPPLPPLPAAQQQRWKDAARSLNAPIAAAEVLSTLQRLRRNKAAGIDGLKAEFILDASEQLAAPLAATFTSLLSGSLPSALNCQVVHPIFKGKGDPLDPNNYRCLSVGPVLAKLYAMILEARLAAWAEQNAVRSPFQAGFRSDHRTTDHIFTLNTLIHQARARKRPLYCCFVDFKKAFDSVPRHLLWQRLQEAGIHGPMLSALQSLYDHVTARANCPSGLTDPFPCDLGVKQGCPLSPLLFGLYIDRITPLLEAADPTAPALAGLAVAALLYADDLALLSTTPTGLQKQLDALHSFCLSSHLTVNLTKTEIIVFGPSPRIPPPTWLFGGTPVTVSDHYRYLGIIFHSTKGIHNAPSHLLEAGERALHSLYRRCIEHHIDTPNIMCKLFDSLITPVLSYACETWAHSPGITTTLNRFEVLHRRFLRRIAGMHHTTLNAAVYGEFGRTPLSLHWLRLSANFFSRLANLPNGRLAKHALLETLHLEQHGRSTGLGTLQSQLTSLGLAAATLDDLAALRPDAIKTATQAQWAAEWQHDLVTPPTSKNPTDSSQRIHYLSIHPAFSPSCQPYLSDPTIPPNHRNTLARFRCGNHWLAEHTSCYAKAAEKRRHHHTPCQVCGIPTWSDPNNILLCDSCNSGFHCQCLDPPLPCPPTEKHWYCPTCTSLDRCHPTALLAEIARLSKATRCPHCHAPKEDIHHFLFQCPFYEPIRARYPDLFPSTSTNAQTWWTQPAARLAEFLFYCFKLHREKLSNTSVP